VYPNTIAALSSSWSGAPIASWLIGRNAVTKRSLYGYRFGSIGDTVFVAKHSRVRTCQIEILTTGGKFYRCRERCRFAAIQVTRERRIVTSIIVSSNCTCAKNV